MHLQVAHDIDLQVFLVVPQDSLLQVLQGFQVLHQDTLLLVLQVVPHDILLQVLQGFQVLPQDILLQVLQGLQVLPQDNLLVLQVVYQDIELQVFQDNLLQVLLAVLQDREHLDSLPSLQHMLTSLLNLAGSSLQ